MKEDLSPRSIQKLCKVPGLHIMVEEEVTSTNTILRQQAEAGALENTVLIAKRQTQGRGRRDRRFFSPPDSGLYLSLLLRPDLPAREALLLTVCAAVAVAEAIEEICGEQALIKWVNDVYCRGRKVCGILTEGVGNPETGGLQYAILGIGVNLTKPSGGFPEELKDIAGWVSSEEGRGDRSRLAGAILNHFYAYYPNLTERPFFAEYEKRSLVLGRDILISEGIDRRPGRALKLNPDFSLVVQEANGRERILDSGEVSIRIK